MTKIKFFLTRNGNQNTLKLVYYCLCDDSKKYIFFSLLFFLLIKYCNFPRNLANDGYHVLSYLPFSE
jgi:hypothetical protein